MTGTLRSRIAEQWGRSASRAWLVRCGGLWLACALLVLALSACGGGGEGDGGGGGEGQEGPLYDELRACDVLTSGYFAGRVQARDEIRACYEQCLLELSCDELREGFCDPLSEPGEACERECDPRFACADGGEAYERERCDGLWQCQDGSDEDGCESVMPPPEVFLCESGMGESSPQSAVCDGRAECADGSDEQDCEYFYCDDGAPVHVDAVCDRVSDCFDNSDESGCPEPEPYLCEDGFPLNADDVCDGNPECQYGEDELDCPGEDSFRCGDGRDIPLKMRCDLQDDCDDSSDEDGCARLSCL